MQITLEVIQVKFWHQSLTFLTLCKRAPVFSIHAPSLSSQKISVVSHLIILVSFAVVLVYYLTSSVSSRLINIFLSFEKKNYLLLNCRSRRETVVIGGKKWDLNLWIQNSGLSPFPMCQDTWPSCPWSSQLIKMRMWLNRVIWMFWAGDKSIFVFVFKAILATTTISAISWHVSVVRLSLVWAYGCKGTGWHTCHLLNYCVQQLTACWCEAHSANGMGVGIWELMYITFSVIFALVRNWAEQKAENISLKWRWPPSPSQRLALFQFFYFILPIIFCQSVYGDISCQDESHSLMLAVLCQFFLRS